MPGQLNTYTELQTGVMPTQYQGFPMPPAQTRQWTEFFSTTSLVEGEDGGPALRKLLSHADYHGTVIPAVDEWMTKRKVPL